MIYNYPKFSNSGLRFSTLNIKKFIRNDLIPDVRNQGMGEMLFKLYDVADAVNDNGINREIIEFKIKEHRKMLRKVGAKTPHGVEEKNMIAFYTALIS